MWGALAVVEYDGAFIANAFIANPSCSVTRCENQPFATRDACRRALDLGSTERGLLVSAPLDANTVCAV